MTDLKVLTIEFDSGLVVKVGYEITVDGITSKLDMEQIGILDHVFTIENDNEKEQWLKSATWPDPGKYDIDEDK